MHATAAEIAECTARLTATQGAEEAAQQELQVVAQTDSAMQRLMHEMSETKPKVDALASNSININQILSVITAIAEQTNLLALNAAIEATRAGEQGPRICRRRRRGAQSGTQNPEIYRRDPVGHRTVAARNAGSCLRPFSVGTSKRRRRNNRRSPR